MPPRDEIAQASPQGALPIAPSLGPTLAITHVPAPKAIGKGDLRTAGLAVAVAALAGVAAALLTRLVDLVTNIAFYGRFSVAATSPWDHHLGLAVVLVPPIGGLIVGIMARYGSTAIRGHGIPEAMERVLKHDSKIPKRITLLKPLSAAVAIGTGGPFGAEGPIIATGGALGSLVGQLLDVTPRQRRALLAAGSAAGMAATFGSPISAVLLAIELLLFELSPRSLVPVALAAATATGVRIALGNSHVPFAMHGVVAPGSGALVLYVALGAVVGVASVWITRAVYAVEHGFEKLPIHWALWPALGGLVVGVTALFEPRVLGVGYENIQAVVNGELAVRALATLAVLKLVAWLFALGSGTSGGTLAPLFTIGGGLGALLGIGLAALLPAAGVDPRLAALVGMAAMFAGASRALLASIVFAFETTREPLGLLPLLGGCTAAFVVSHVLMRHSIMTEKIASRGVVVPSDYRPDPLATTRVLDLATRDVTTVTADETAADAAERLLGAHTHQAFPVVEGTRVIGVVTRRELAAGGQAQVRALVRRAPVVVRDDAHLRDAVDRMIHEEVGRVPIVTEAGELVGIVSRSDVLRVYRVSFADERLAPR